MADAQPPGAPSGWMGLLYFVAVTLVTLGADYIRRIMPPPRRALRRKNDPPTELEDEEG